MSKNDVADNVSYDLPADWRGQMMTRIRKLMKKADPEILEDVKWKTASNPQGNLVWYHDGMICTGEVYKKHLRLSFAKGPALKDQDPEGLINSYRAILIHEGDTLNEKAFMNLIQAAVTLNIEGKAK